MRNLTLGLLMGVLVLTGCGLTSPSGPPPPCPNLSLVPDAGRVVRFDGSGQDLSAMVFTAVIDDAHLICDYDDSGISIEMAMTIITERGPAETRRQADFTYFVAIATVDETILAREAFALSVPFGPSESRVAAFQNLNQYIPLPEGKNGRDYVIYLGFELSEDELRFNRLGR